MCLFCRLNIWWRGQRSDALCAHRHVKGYYHCTNHWELPTGQPSTIKNVLSMALSVAYLEGAWLQLQSKHPQMQWTLNSRTVSLFAVNEQFMLKGSHIATTCIERVTVTNYPLTMLSHHPAWILTLQSESRLCSIVNNALWSKYTWSSELWS